MLRSPFRPRRTATAKFSASCVQKRRSRASGAAIAEAAAAIAVLIPLLLLMLMVIVETSIYFIIKQQLAYVARQAAHEIAYAYGVSNVTTMNSGAPGSSGVQGSGAANTGDSTYSGIVKNIAVPGVINPNSTTQFSTYFNIPNASYGVSPSPASPMMDSYVTVVVTYKSGPNLPPFPWNPFTSGLASFDLTGLQVVSNCSWPIPHS
ncbi:MAG TPA: TadE/TadG family type IV pilus assembly protein [Oculatellaceae cyanobacterium]